ncbi:ABC transporter permease [Leptospira bouyouniensis]|uniref:ABC transporter permease n=1 Tax=Leptospira bouyouniensis TaxID=2484911 RepID=A0A7I0HR03_9LEPT|nr:ABC transporter permease [Leptospira bouyouniensis]TGL04784.1 ABC transporter permease [Leptospira bouyouniensis]
MIQIYFHFIFGYFKDHLSKIIFNILSISLGIALFVSTQINGWKAEKSLIDQTIGFNEKNFIGRYVYTGNLIQNRSNHSILKNLDDSLPNGIIVEPELHLKGYFKIEDNQIISIPVIGRDMITHFNFENRINTFQRIPKYILSKSLLHKLKTSTNTIQLSLCNKQLEINISEIEEISKDGIFAIMDLERLQNFCNLTNSYTTIKLINLPYSKFDEKNFYPTNTFNDWTFESKKEIIERAGIALGSLKINLMIISLVSVLISFFMVSNIYTGLFLSRKIEFGILLSMGGTRLNNFLLFIVLSILMGFLGGGIGTYLGITISKLNLVKTVSTVTDSLQIESYQDFPNDILFFGITLSVFGSIISAMFNSIKAYNILPIELLRDKNESSVNSPINVSNHSKWIILILLISSGILIGNLKIEKQILPGLIGVALVILGFIILNFISIPYFIKGIKKLTNTLNLSPSFIIGLKEIELDSWKNGLIISTIMLSTSLVFTLSTLTMSYESSLKHWIDEENKSDFSLINEEKLSSGEPGVPIELFHLLKTKNIFLEVEPFFINSKFILNGKYFTLHVLNLSNSFNKDQILVSKNLCFLEKICKGDIILINSEKKGQIRLEIQGEKEHFFSERGTILMDFELFKKLFSTEFLNSIRLTFYKNTKRDEAYEFVQLISKKYNLVYLDQNQLKKLYLEGMNQVFSVLDTLKISAILISVLSLVTSIFYFVKEKSKILAGLKAIGMSLTQLYSLLFYQILFLLCSGILSGILNSLILAPIVVFGINQNAFGWNLIFSFPVHFVAKLPILIPIFTAIITLIPFYFIYRMKISKELNYE